MADTQDTHYGSYLGDRFKRSYDGSSPSPSPYHQWYLPSRHWETRRCVFDPPGHFGESLSIVDPVVARLEKLEAAAEATRRAEAASAQRESAAFARGMFLATQPTPQANNMPLRSSLLDDPPRGSSGGALEAPSDPWMSPASSLSWGRSEAARRGQPAPLAAGSGSGGDARAFGTTSEDELFLWGEVRVGRSAQKR